LPDRKIEVVYIDILNPGIALVGMQITEAPVIAIFMLKIRKSKPVPPVNIIVPFFWSLFAIAIRLQSRRSDGAGHPGPSSTSGQSSQVPIRQGQVTTPSGALPGSPHLTGESPFLIRPC